jgi:hypothetical protein
MDERDEQIITDANKGFNGLGHVARALFLTRDTLVRLDEAGTRQQDHMAELTKRIETLTRMILWLTIVMVALGLIQAWPQLFMLYQAVRGVITGVYGQNLPLID